ncbi:MAG: hypothetical protein M3N07_05890 [Pseudomonadota bacterium]|nr:hypothetical protein [Pseudomonadota bacterium]
MRRTIIAAAAALAGLLCAAGAPTVEAGASAQATAPSQRVDRDFLLGRWTDTGDCTDTVEFLRDGRFVTSQGGAGVWTLDGDRLTFQAERTVSARVQATDRNTIVLIHADGSRGRSTRCGAAPASRRVAIPALPQTIPQALAISRPIGRRFLIGRWTDDGDCSNFIDFLSDGRFQVHDGEGRWTLSGEQLAFIGERTVRARARGVGSDRIILIHEDGTIGQSVRC